MEKNGIDSESIGNRKKILATERANIYLFFFGILEERRSRIMEHKNNQDELTLYMASYILVDSFGSLSFISIYSFKIIQ